MELNTYRLNSLEEPTDAQLHALMEQVAMSARESSRHAELELKHRMQAVKELLKAYRSEKAEKDNYEIYPSLIFLSKVSFPIF